MRGHWAGRLREAPAGVSLWGDSEPGCGSAVPSEPACALTRFAGLCQRRLQTPVRLCCLHHAWGPGGVPLSVCVGLGGEAIVGQQVPAATPLPATQSSQLHSESSDPLILEGAEQKQLSRRESGQALSTPGLPLE